MDGWINGWVERWLKGLLCAVNNIKKQEWISKCESFLLQYPLNFRVKQN